MRDLTASDFDTFFQSLWGKPPFAWQLQLARRVLENPSAPWPEIIGLPTGSGKTACIDIAVFTLAASVGMDDARSTVPPLPRRLFFTVDRRIIVDEAFNRACKIAGKLRAAQDGILKDVADRLRILAGETDDTAHPLEAHILRGGMYRDEAWAKSPSKPVIVCTTVDQLGSRLLFRAYGRSFKAWPIHAGLAANDSLILLDEAHCSRPLMQTLTAIGQYRTWAQEPLPNPFFVSIMTATPPSGSTDVFHDESGEPRDPQHPLGRRQLAHKLASLCAPVTGTGKTVDNKVAEALAKLAREHATDSPRAVVVFCNRVATARAVHALLSKGKRPAGQSVLLTGRMRPIDRDDVAGTTLAELASDRSEHRALDKPVFVVATQTLEVGADLDFDALVTECASLDALRQRFGRLNRMGRNIDARASIVVRDSQAKDSSDDPVYGAALANTWQWLGQISDADTVDFGISAMETILPIAETLAELSTAPPLTPIMLPAHVDTWAQTAPHPEPSAAVSLFLHGVQRGSADIQVCWRADIALGDNIDDDIACNTITLAPPSTAECLPVPMALFRRWLVGKPIADTSSDLEGEDAGSNDKDDEPTSPHKAIRWRNRNDVKVIDGSTRLRPGDICILAADRKASMGLGDLPATESGPSVPDNLLDIGDRAALQTRARPRLRLHQALLDCWPQTDSVVACKQWLKTGPASYDEDPENTTRELRNWLRKIAEELDDNKRHAWLKQASAVLANDKKARLDLHPDNGFILSSSIRLKQQLSGASFGDEDDATASGTVNMTLPAHLDGVGTFAMRFAKACGLPEPLVEALRKAGRLHDLGKADPRFQAILRNGNLWARGPLLAKSGSMPRSRKRYRAIREASGYPKGGRHELLSVRLAESVPDLLPADPMLRDLVLHLVASHHGYCRPFAPVVIDPSPQQVKVDFDGQLLLSNSDTQLERLDSGVSERYWRLTRHYGWWGLAWLEAILRLADHRRSEWEEHHAGETHDQA